MRIVFIGNVNFSLRALERIVAIGGNVVGVCTKKYSKFNTDHVDLTEFAKIRGIDSCYADDINSEEVYAWISSKNPDIIFCLGWSQLLKKNLIDLPPMGIIGYHPGALPANRGRHPIIWTLVLGLKKSSSTFFYIDHDVDSGDIISQFDVAIDVNDDAFTLYHKLIFIAQQQIDDLLPKLMCGMVTRVKQDPLLGNVWRKRTYLDGQIDWRMSAESVYNLVRGLTRPYSGAHFLFNGEPVKTWKTRVIHENFPNFEPGKVLGHTEGKPIVKCGFASVCLLDVDPKINLVTGAYL
jgi:methionyl-tRNA formyltransferase